MAFWRPWWLAEGVILASLLKMQGLLLICGKDARPRGSSAAILSGNPDLAIHQESSCLSEARDESSKLEDMLLRGSGNHGACVSGDKR